MQNFELDIFQKEAIEYARNNNSVIVSAPTGAGKTLIAEYIIEDCLLKNKGIIYTAPIKALSNQKFRDFSKKYPNKVGIVTGDVGINEEAQILIMTTEIFRNAILIEPDRFKYRDWVIFDEIHYLDDIERGTVWEEAIILLPKNMHFLALSATIPNIYQFSKWLESVHHFPVKVVIEKKRPVPLHFLFQCNNEFFDNLESLKKSGFIRRKSSSSFYCYVKHNRIFTLLDYLKKKNGYPCIYFTFSRKKCEALAEEVGFYNLLNNLTSKEGVEIFNEYVKKLEIKSTHTDFLSKLISRGIAYHHAGLLPALKEIIEDLFSRGFIKLIFTTETFALGINMPARTVVFDTIKKIYGHYERYLKVRDLYQMAGRAGRRGIDKQGSVIIRISPFTIDAESLEKLIYGEYEPINSQLNSCYATILNLYKIMNEKIYDIYPLSFHFYQSRDFQKKQALELLKRKILLLKKLNYIVDNNLSFKADLASKVYSFELQIGELFESGFLENLSAKDLFIVITALVYEPRKGEKKIKLPKNIKKIKNELDSFLGILHKEEKSFKIFPLCKRFFFNLSEVARLWFEGAKFYTLTKFSEVDEGEIVRYFRMSIQVLREIYSSKVISYNLKSKILECIGRVNKDVVDAERDFKI